VLTVSGILASPSSAWQDPFAAIQMQQKWNYILSFFERDTPSIEHKCSESNENIFYGPGQSSNTQKLLLAEM
jgi:hypothetical protein